jgi:hypothetical protein
MAGRGALNPLPAKAPKAGAGAGSPPETNAGRAAVFAEETDIRNLRREFETYKTKHPPVKQAEIDELKLLLGSIRTNAFVDTDDGHRSAAAQ